MHIGVTHRGAWRRLSPERSDSWPGSQSGPMQSSRPGSQANSPSGCRSRSRPGSQPGLWPARERGAALMVAMVMIFMLSVMGISAMRTSTLEKRMTTNAIQSSTTLQAAESATEQMLNSTEILRAAAEKRDTIMRVETDVVRADIGLTSNSEIVYVGDGPAFGYSSDFMTLRYVAQGDSQIADVRARSIVRQGAKRVVPRP